MSLNNILIVGAGQAGLQLGVSLRDNNFEGHICLVGDEKSLPYQRPPLSKSFLKNEVTDEGLCFRTDGFFAEKDIELIRGQKITVINRDEKSVVLSSGKELSYDHLVLATGTKNRKLPVPGAELDGVVYLRTLEEAIALKERIASCKSVAVIGAGFIGLEFAAVANSLGRHVTVIEMTKRAMGRAVCPEVSEFLCDCLKQSGVSFRFNTGIDEIGGSGGKASFVKTTTGEIIAADLILVGIGVIANASLADQAGLQTDNGIVVDEMLVTEDQSISAIGDCASFPNHQLQSRKRLESVQNAVDQARCVAARLTGHAYSYKNIPWFWSDQGKNKLQIAGLPQGADKVVKRGNVSSGSFSFLFFKSNKFIAIESVNKIADHIAGRKILETEVSFTLNEAKDNEIPLKIYLKKN